ncbi:1-deoxy-D-xylulose-5-phosphate synthase [Candidatus Omnitrophota bacterium]
MTVLVDRINSPKDLQAIPLRELPLVAHEIREKIIEVVSKTGGHLASSLGAVELTVALHYCLHCPDDKIIWDVGHQSYPHKILTGRAKRFHTLRQYKGISGFPHKDESACDPFTTGHSSTAVSLALGLATARDLNGTDEDVVAVIGDGSLTGGLCFEALNNAGHLNKDIIVILNTNEMSIAPSVGALSTYLNKIISQPIYNRFREALEHFIETRIPRVGARMLKLSGKFEEVLKGLIIPGIFFEELGFRYFGPLDGHDLNILVPTLKNILTLKGPRILHVVTKKGKGYLPAETRPVKFHSAVPFDIESGNPKPKKATQDTVTYTKVFSDTIVELAQQHEKIVAITAAMPEGTGLDVFAQRFPERFFDVGIAEEHAVCFAAGLAKGGLKPVVAIYSTFLQRAFDQLMEAVALQNLPVVFAVDRAGLVGVDGATHHGISDIAYLKNIPNFVLMAPKNLQEFKAMLTFAVGLDAPSAIRYPKVAEMLQTDASDDALAIGKAEVLREGNDVALLALGTMVKTSLEVAKDLVKNKINATVINARFIKPLDESLLKRLVTKYTHIVTLEEGIVDGGFGTSVLEKLHQLCRKGTCPKVLALGLPTEFITHATRDELFAELGLDKDSLVKKIQFFIRV